MTEEYDDYDDGFEPPEIAPPDPDAEDTRPIAKRRRRAPATNDSATNAKSSTKQAAPKVADQDWGFEDDDESSFIAEWKLGVGLVVVLIAGFGVVAWKKYDTIKAMAQDKLEALSGKEEVVAANPDDDKPAPKPTGENPLANVAMTPPESPRTDGITTANSSLEKPKNGSAANSLIASFGGGSSTAKNSVNSQPVPPPADIGWGQTKKTEPKLAAKDHEVSFDFGPSPTGDKLASKSPTVAKKDDPKTQADPFALLDLPDEKAKEPQEMKLANNDSKPVERTANPFNLAPIESASAGPTGPSNAEPAKKEIKNTPAMDLAVEPFDLGSSTAPKPKQAPKPVNDPFSLDVPDLAANEPPKNEPPKQKMEPAPNPFSLEPINTAEAPTKPKAPSPFDAPAIGLTEKSEATDPFAIEPITPRDSKVAVVPEVRTRPQPAADPFSLDPLPTKTPESPAPRPADNSPAIALPSTPPVRNRQPVTSTPKQPAALDPFELPTQPPTQNPQMRSNQQPLVQSPFDGGLTIPSPNDPQLGGLPTTTPRRANPNQSPPQRKPVPQVGPQRVDVAVDTRQYTVGDGESYWTISKRQYGTVRYFAALAEYNKRVVSNPKSLRPGMKIELPPADVLEPLVTTATIPTVTPRSARPMATLRPEAHTARRHSVQPGENYWSISKKQYGSSRFFAALAEWNKRTVPDPRTLRPGTTIELPAVSELEPLVATASPNGPSPAKSTDTGANGFFLAADGTARYRVGPGETLGSIALKSLGRATRASQIFAMNRDILRSENSLSIGTVLRLPPDHILTATQTR